MKRCMHLWIAAVAVAAAYVPASAPAMPGQTAGDFQSWAKGNAALHGLTRKMNEMTADFYYSASFRTPDGLKGAFESTVGGSNKIAFESVAIETQDERYDILQHPQTAAALVRTVYGSDVASDFQSAAKVGSWKLYQDTMRTALYKGTRFGYEVAHEFVQVWPLDQVAVQAKTLASCATRECGD